MIYSVSIVIVSYHTGPALFDCLQAVLALPEAAEIILVDNGNPDSVLQRLQALVTVTPRLRLLTNHGNIGFAQGVNLGVRAATARWLWILNPDSLPEHNALTRLLMHAASVPQPALIGARIINPDGSEQRGGRRAILTPWLALVEALGLYKIFPTIARFNWHQHPPPDSALTPSPGITGAAMFLPRDAYLATGGLDEAYFLHVEDMDFCLRWQRAGHKAYYAADVILPHLGGTSDVPSPTIERYKAVSFARYFKTHFPKSAWVTGPLVWLRYWLIIGKARLGLPQ